MTKQEACWNWQALTVKELGVDSNGNEITTRTSFGQFVAGAGVPLYIYPGDNVSDTRHIAAKFLRKWADALESETAI